MNTRRKLEELKKLMREAIENCETCRGVKDGCARCVTFSKALDSGNDKD